MARDSRLYVPLWVEYADDPQVITAGERAEVLFIRALAVMKRTLSDGFLADGQLPRFGLPGVKARAEALVAVGLWERVDGGYLCPSFLKWNRSRAEQEAISLKRSGAAKTKQVAQQVASNLRPKAEQSREKGTCTPAADAAVPYESDFAAWYDRYPRKRERGAALKAYRARRRAGVAAEDLLSARDNYAASVLGVEVEHVKYPASFLSGADGPWSEWVAGAPEPQAFKAMFGKPEPVVPTRVRDGVQERFMSGAGWVPDASNATEGVR